MSIIVNKVVLLEGKDESGDRTLTPRKNVCCPVCSKTLWNERYSHKKMTVMLWLESRLSAVHAIELSPSIYIVTCSGPKCKEIIHACPL